MTWSLQCEDLSWPLRTSFHFPNYLFNILSFHVMESHCCFHRLSSLWPDWAPFSKQCMFLLRNSRTTRAIHLIRAARRFPSVLSLFSTVASAPISSYPFHERGDDRLWTRTQRAQPRSHDGNQNTVDTCFQCLRVEFPLSALRPCGSNLSQEAVRWPVEKKFKASGCRSFLFSLHHHLRLKIEGCFMYFMLNVPKSLDYTVNHYYKLFVLLSIY